MLWNPAFPKYYQNNLLIRQSWFYSHCHHFHNRDPIVCQRGEGKVRILLRFYSFAYVGLSMWVVWSLNRIRYGPWMLIVLDFQTEWKMDFEARGSKTIGSEVLFALFWRVRKSIRKILEWTIELFEIYLPG